jgi:hypothetical protein
MAEPKKVKRYDSLDPGRWMTTPFTRTTEGFLTGRAIVTSIGVFTYRNADGTTSRELRLPEEVFDTESLASMKLKPVVNDHPAEKITPANTQELAVGSLGSLVTTTAQEKTWDGYTPSEKLTDGLHVAIDMTINRAETIEDVLNGKRSLSMGYECEIEKADEGATWLGMAYDSIQRKIRYNHCAIVDAARAGDAARIRLDGKDRETEDALGIHLDSGDAVRVDIKPSGETGGGNQANYLEEQAMKYRLDNGMEYDAPEGFVQAYVSMKEKADSADKSLAKEREDHKAAISKLEGERDGAKDRADKAEAEAKKAKEDAAISPDRVKAAAKEMAALYDAADRAGVEVKDDMADLDIEKAVITAVFPKADLKDKDEAYIKARYDSAVEMLENKADGESRAVAGGIPSAETRTDSKSARERMVELNRRLSRGEKTEGV